MKAKKITGAALAGGKGFYNRVEDDYYATPKYATRLFIDKLMEDNIKLKGSFLEPACGGGHISDVLIEYFGDDNVFSFDLVDRGYARLNGVKDFLTDDFKRFDNIITNPPFKYAKEFILKSLSISNDKVMMLCKIQLLEGVKRYDLFKNTPLKYVYVYSSRVATYRNGVSRDENGRKWATTMCLAWFVWEKGYIGDPVIRWIR